MSYGSIYEESWWGSPTENDWGSSYYDLASSGLEGFVFDVDTTQLGVSTSTQFKLPLASNGTTNAEVDWGDGSTDTLTSWNQAETTHTYSTSGIYTITITGTLEGWFINNGGDKLKIKEVKNWGNGNGLTLKNVNGGYFMGASNMTCIATDAPTISASNFQQVFRDVSSIVSGVKNWDVSGVTNLVFAFYQANDFNEDLSNWDVSNVTNFKYCFERCFDLDQSFASWDMSSAIDVGRMFKSTTMSTANYDATLIGWASQSLNSGLSIDFGSARYTAGGDAEAARNTLINTYGWTIVDGGSV
jgi:surface protein